MTNILVKTQNYLASILRHFLKREFTLGLYVFAQKLPNWLFRFKKAFFLENSISSMKLPESLNPSANVIIASIKDTESISKNIENISRVSNWDCLRVEQLLKSGAVCFLASLDGDPPAALTWLAFGRCFIKGVGYNYHFPSNSAYGVFSITQPEYRRKGLYLQMNKSIVEYAKKNGIDTYGVIVEFTNTYSLGLRDKLGFIRKFEITYIKILFLKISIQKDIIKNKFLLKIFVREPKGHITII